MASPHVAGVAALLLARTPSLTASALRARLTTYAVGPATQYGVGLVNAYNGLTQSHGPPTQVFALLDSAVSGSVVPAVSTHAGGGFRWPRPTRSRRRAGSRPAGLGARKPRRSCCTTRRRPCSPRSPATSTRPTSTTARA